ncbi:MAG: T9SS type A sorting domain-containing protein [Flavobacteriales bacterium]|nr:T9SS type A sorting domain-containing protein [Flavobacteriales bacterium]
MDNYFLGHPISGTRTVVWPVFSVEYPSIGQLPNPYDVPCSSTYLGLYLAATDICSSSPCVQNGISQTIFEGCGQDKSFKDVEILWLNGKDFASTPGQICNNGIDLNTPSGDTFFNDLSNPNPGSNNYINVITPYNPASNPLGNIYEGFMYFTYSLMRNMNYRKASGIPSARVVPTLASESGQWLSINLDSSLQNEELKYTIFSVSGTRTDEGQFHFSGKQIQIQLAALASGIYFLTVQGSEGFQKLYKLIIL